MLKCSEFNLAQSAQCPGRSYRAVTAAHIPHTLVSTLLNSTHYKVLSFKRDQGKSGGGAAVIYDETKFFVEEIVHDVPSSVEAAWALLTPRTYDHHLQKIKRICVGSIYISPRSKHKVETIEHLVHTIHSVRATFDNEVNFCFGCTLFAVICATAV